MTEYNAKKVLLKDLEGNYLIPYTENSAGMPIGTIYPLSCSSSYVPEGSLPTDGAEYSKAQFTDLWENYLTGESYYAYYAEGLYAGGTETVYTTTETLSVGDTLYTNNNGEMIVYTTISEVGEDYLTYSYDVDEANTGLIATATRDTTKDIRNSLLNTCTYAAYQQEIDTYGQCAKFAVDDVNEVFRVPTSKQIERYLISKKEPTEGDQTWYNLYSDGWLEQGGYIPNSPTGEVSVTFLKEFVDTNYNLVGASISSSTTAATLRSHSVGYNLTTSGFTAYIGGTFPKYWRACGYADISSYPLPKNFVVVANGSINQSQMDWSEWASSLEGKMNADLSNLTSDGKLVIDGQWVGKTAILTQSVTAGETTIDMSEYLPNDSYQYEVLILVSLGDTGENLLKVYSDIIPVGTLGLDMASSGCYNGGYMTLPVGTGRKIYQHLDAAAASNNYRGIEALAYRRLGTNQ